MTILAVFLVLSFFQGVAGVGASPLADVTGHWAEREIRAAVEQGYVSGYPDGTFKPEGTITRAEFLKMLLAAQGIKPLLGGPLTFADVADHWVHEQGWLPAAAKAGLVELVEMPDGLFHPNRPATRQEIAFALARAGGAGTEDEKGIAKKFGVASRAEAVVLLERALRPAEYSAAATGADAVPVLVYHHLAPAAYGLHEKNAVVTATENFQQHLDWLARHEYYTAGLQELGAWLDGLIQLPEKTVVITFDDGYESVFREAHPLIKEKGFKAVFFLILSRVQQETTQNYDPTILTRASWAQLRDMKESGLWEMEHHSYGAHRKDENGGGLYLAWEQEEIVQDVRAGNDLLVRKGFPATTALAYPYGHFDDEVVAAMEQTDLQMAFTVQEGCVRRGDHPFQLPRIGVFSWHGAASLAKLLSC